MAYSPKFLTIIIFQKPHKRNLSDVLHRQGQRLLEVHGNGYRVWQNEKCVMFRDMTEAG